MDFSRFFFVSTNVCFLFFLIPCWDFGRYLSLFECVFDFHSLSVKILPRYVNVRTFAILMSSLLSSHFRLLLLLATLFSVFLQLILILSSRFAHYFVLRDPTVSFLRLSSTLWHPIAKFQSWSFTPSYSTYKKFSPSLWDRKGNPSEELLLVWESFTIFPLKKAPHKIRIISYISLKQPKPARLKQNKCLLKRGKYI